MGKKKSFTDGVEISIIAVALMLLADHARWTSFTTRAACFSNATVWIKRGFPGTLL